MRKGIVAAILLVLQLSMAVPAQAVISNGAPAFDVLGQYDSTSGMPLSLFTKGGLYDSPNNRGFNQPDDVELDAINHRLFVSDHQNNRVLVYALDANNLLIDHYPDYVLGAPDFVTPGSLMPSATSMNRPTGLA